MERYRTPTPRSALAIAAALATLATLAVAVAPVTAPVEAAARTTLRAPTEVAIMPARIDVVGVRTQNAARNDTARDVRSASNPG